MRAHAQYNFHLPLPADLHEMLRQEVEQSGQAATILAREALREWLRERRRRRLSAEIAAYAEAVAGTVDDLDTELEEAGIQAVAEEEGG